MSVTSLTAQDNILELLPGSDKLEFDEASGTHRLIGNVNFIYQGNTMYCDSAYYYEKRQAVKAYGNVHINKKDTLNLFCDSLFYNGRTKLAKLWGNVRVRDNEFKLTTDSLNYDAQKGQASYTYGGRVENIINHEVLTSDIGYFHPESKNFFFSKNVKYSGKDISMETDTLRYRYSEKKTYFYGPTTILSDSTTILCESGWFNTETEEGTLTKNASIQRSNDYISGDTLIYRPNEGTSYGKGNVFYSDSIEQISFKGDYALVNDSMNYAFLTGHAIAIKELKNDTVYIHADTLYNFKNDSSQLVKAYHDAVIFSSTFQAVSDSIAYVPDSNRLELYESPIVWSNDAELKGEFMEVHLEDSVVHQVTIHNNASVVMEVEKDTFYNQIKGKMIYAHFRNNDLYRTDVEGSAMTIFFPEETTSTDSTEVTERKGMNRLYASDLVIYIDSNEISGITYLEQPDGVFYPIDKIKKQELYIPNFSWMNARKPKRVEDLIMDEPEAEIQLD